MVVAGEAENGEKAVELVASLRPDLVLMDVEMPVLDGIEASKRIKELYPETAIIMLTSHDCERDIYAALAAGAGGYCLKNVASERLYAAIRCVSVGDIWIDATIAGKVLKHYKWVVESEIEEKESLSVKGQDDLPSPLSTRELDVLYLLVDGLTNQEIADKLIISLATAKTHVRSILNKLAVDDRTQAAVQAMRRGLV